MVDCSTPLSQTHSPVSLASNEPPKKRKRGRPRKRPPSDDGEDDNAYVPPKDALAARRARRLRRREQESDSEEDGEVGQLEVNLFEYQWVLEEGRVEWFMLQEHVAEFLDIRGMQRKYPGE